MKPKLSFFSLPLELLWVLLIFLLIVGNMFVLIFTGVAPLFRILL